MTTQIPGIFSGTIPLWYRYCISDPELLLARFMVPVPYRVRESYCFGTDCTCRNRMAQHIFGYTAAEALGKTPPDLSAGPSNGKLANLLLQRAVKGESWSGEFPAINKNREMFNVVCSVVPYRDEYGTIVGVLVVATDARPFRELRPGLSAPKRSSADNFGKDLHKPFQTTVTSKITNMASKVMSKMRNNMVHDGRSSDNYDCDFAPSTNYQFTENRKTYSNRGSESKPGIHKVLSSKAEACVRSKGISWPLKEKEKDTSVIRMGHFGCPWLHNDHHEQNIGPEMSSSASNRTEALGSWSSSCSASTPGNSEDHYINKFDVEISWDDLMIGKQIGQGSCGIAYRALWYGSDVVVKVFTKLQYPGDVILSFRTEVSLMKRLRHPNILLFMGAVTTPQHLCIVTEFLPRCLKFPYVLTVSAILCINITNFLFFYSGSLFQLLRKNTAKLDWRRQVHIAMDIAHGMNYLHHFQPPIIHRDLKSLNVFVDKNWTVKPQWMAPEVLRNEQADERSDVYSYGVVLWEIITGKIPWDDLNPMQLCIYITVSQSPHLQVVGVVGFMNQRLEIPNDINPEWAALIESCWSRFVPC
ncbi:PAS domain-containing protein tyrosine kinase family protein [Artemisia annua]|uniref:non-specific serine/threonine protein kinase n=1 Tax=Artemisia annua TaxID=35608 RepID=A0A2U1NYR6_ARTAN|nr:PAS domain-containing protein tyrosine kinase family protein [Artemisia annua]